ncbi:MAG: Maf family protein [Thermodesulfobacteriota bacterium]
MSSRLILASKSPRRSELLRQVGLEFEVVPTGVKEDFVQGESPQEHVIRLAQAKARDVASKYPEHWVIAADTIVCINGSILGKPNNRQEALEMLRCLSGQEHWVLTGFAVCHLAKGEVDQEAVQTTVKVKSLTPAEMEWYVKTGEPFDKAGGYGIQGIGSFMIESIQGSYTNVVGLPLCELIQMLKRLGAIAFPPPCPSPT